MDSRIAQSAEAAGASAVAVSLYDYQTAQSFSFQGGRSFHAASTVKVPILLAVYQCAEEGRIRLDDTLHVRNRFRSVADGKFFRVASSRDGDTEVHQRLGRSLRVRELARAMIVRSSNLATNLLLDYIGVETVQRMAREAKLEGIEVRRGVEDTAAFDQGLNNAVTADGLVRCFRLLCHAGFVREETREQMLEILRSQEFNAMIPARLPAEAKVAHKTGEISTICHDAGIVFLPGRQPYVLAILTEWPAAVEKRHGCVAAISREIYDHLCPNGKGSK